MALALLAVLALPINQAKADEPSVVSEEKGTSVIDIIASVPALKQGIAYSFADSNVNYLSTIDVVNFKGFSLEAGYAGRAKETGDKIVAVVSYDLFKAKDYVTWPVLQYVEFRPGLWAGVGRITGSNEFDWGVSATVLSLKF